MVHSQPFRRWRAPFLIGQHWPLMRSWFGKVTAGLSNPNRPLPPTSSRSLQPCLFAAAVLLQLGDVHLVRDAIGGADALDIAVLHHILQAPQHRYAG